MSKNSRSRTRRGLSWALLFGVLLCSRQEARAGLLDFFKGFTISGKGQGLSLIHI